MQLIKIFLEDESGQGITEYGAVLAFVGLIIASVFSFGQGSLRSAISNAFASITNALMSINANAS